MEDKPSDPAPVPPEAPASATARVRRPVIGEDMAGFIERLMAARTFRSLGSRELSVRAHLSAGAVSEIESGKVKSVTLRTAYRLADALDVRRSWLLCGDGESEKKHKVT